MASVSAQAPEDLRVALVIGNSAYARAPLHNPANDAQAMGKALKALGFDVIEVSLDTGGLPHSAGGGGAPHRPARTPCA